MQRGDFVVVTGRVGSGKSTLVRMLSGLLNPDSGEICWNGQPVHDPAAFFRPPRSAYTAQVPRLFSEPLRDNILLGLPEDQVDLPGAIDASVLEPDVAELEKGLDTLVGPRGVRLSGGQVQRAAAARMFVRDPELLVFDDLSSALDVETEQAAVEAAGRTPPRFQRRADLPGGIAPPPGSAPRRLDRGDERRAHRSPGQAGRSAGYQRRDAAPVARGDRGNNQLTMGIEPVKPYQEAERGMII